MFRIYTMWTCKPFVVAVWSEMVDWRLMDWFPLLSVIMCIGASGCNSKHAWRSTFLFVAHWAYLKRHVGDGCTSCVCCISSLRKERTALQQVQNKMAADLERLLNHREVLLTSSSRGAVQSGPTGSFNPTLTSRWDPGVRIDPVWPATAVTRARNLSLWYSKSCVCFGAPWLFMPR